MFKEVSTRSTQIKELDGDNVKCYLNAISDPECGILTNHRLAI